MRKFAFTIAAALSAVLSVALSSGAETHTLTLKQAVARALAQNPEVVMARLDEAKASLGVRLASSPFTPHLGVGTGLAYTNGFPLSIEGAAPAAFEARGNEYLFNKPQSYAIAQAKESVRSAGFASGEKSDEIAYRVASLYIDADRAGRLADSAQKQVESQEKVLETARARVEEGRELAVTAQEANVNLLRARQRLITLQSDREYASRSLAVTLGYGESDLVTPAEEDRPAPAIPENEEAAIQTALSTSKEIKRLESNYSAKGLEIKGDKAKRLPKVDLVAQYALLTKYNHYQEYFATFSRNNGELGASIEVPIFVGSGAKAEIQQAENDQQHIHAEVEVARNKIMLDIHQSYQDIHKTDIARELAQADLDLARSQLSVILAQMGEGRASLRQVEEARFNEDEKWIAFYDAQFNAERARLNILRQTGELMAALKRTAGGLCRRLSYNRLEMRTVPLVLISFVFLAQAQQPASLTAQEDRQRLMDLLHITSLRNGANGSNPQAPNYANYDESKANPYPDLPDPLLLKNGKKVTTAKMWWEQRRPEIVEDFDREIYGRVPKVMPAVRWEVTKTTEETVGDVPVVTKQLVGDVDNSAYPQIAVDIQATLTTPAQAAGPVPVIMELGATFGPLRGRGRGPAPAGPGWQQQVLAKGWGYAVLNTTSVQADNGAGLSAGIIGLANKGQPRKVDDWGALRAWAWGAARVLDYFETDKSVDAKHVGIEGHSRYGKAVALAMAYDSRFAIAFVSSSGEGGVKIHRRNWGELVENVAAPNEYHWMAGNFLKYAGPLHWNDMPVDSHELVALCAPRPVFISAGATNGDGWVDAKGMFLAAAGAGPVYKLLGRKDMGTTEFPPIETALIDGDVAFRQHTGGHTPTPNWPTFIAFAARYLNGQ